MTGGLIQLVSYGAQDVYLTSNPQITFFKIVYRRYTHFAMETVRQNLSSTATFSSTCYAPINRVGDLMTKMWLRTTMNYQYKNGGTMFDTLKLLKNSLF